LRQSLLTWFDARLIGGLRVIVHFGLMALSAVSGVTLLILARNEGGTDGMLIKAHAIFLIANAGFLWHIRPSRQPREPSRIRRMFGLWMKAKEADMERRATGDAPERP
jgi:uncharacterized membrane protein YqjE